MDIWELFKYIIWILNILNIIRGNTCARFAVVIAWWFRNRNDHYVRKRIQPIEICVVDVVFCYNSMRSALDTLMPPLTNECYHTWYAPAGWNKLYMGRSQTHTHTHAHAHWVILTKGSPCPCPMGVIISSAHIFRVRFSLCGSGSRRQPTAMDAPTAATYAARPNDSNNNSNKTARYRVASPRERAYVCSVCVCFIDFKLCTRLFGVQTGFQLEGVHWAFELNSNWNRD